MFIDALARLGALYFMCEDYDRTCIDDLCASPFSRCLTQDTDTQRLYL